MLTNIDDLLQAFQPAPASSDAPAPGKSTPPAFRRAVPEIDYRDKRFMVIDDQDSTRQSLRLSIQNMGGSKVAFGTNYGDAIHQLRKTDNPPDVILCDYNLQDGRDGQQLFEELRKREIILEETVFIMVTAERAYEHVVSVVELAPDDYVLKPFTPSRLRLRLDRVVAKKEFLQPYFRQKRAKDLTGASLALDRLMSSPEGAAYRFDIMRHRAETFMLAGRSAEARETYESILAAHPFPWAKVGLARALSMAQMNVEARALLDEVTISHPNYFAALDLKADVCRAQGDFRTAQETLLHAVGRNPKNWDRKKALAETAMLNGDAATARTVMADVLKNNTMPGECNARERISLSRMALQDGDTEGALQPLFDIPADALAGLCDNDRLSIRALCAAASPEAHGAAFARHRRQILAMEAPSVELGLDFVRAGLATEDLELATRLAFTLLDNKQTRTAFKGLLMVFAAAGKEAELREVQRTVAEKIASDGHAHEH